MYFHYIWNMFHILPCRWNHEKSLFWYYMGRFMLGWCDISGDLLYFLYFGYVLFSYNIRCTKVWKYRTYNTIKDHFIMSCRFASRCMSGSCTIVVTLWISLSQLTKFGSLVNSGFVSFRFGEICNRFPSLWGSCKSFWSWCCLHAECCCLPYQGN